MTPHIPDLAALHAKFLSWPLKKRAKKMLEWYERHPGVWEALHPDQKPARRSR